MTGEVKKLEEKVKVVEEKPKEVAKRPLVKSENPLETITNGYNTTMETYNASPIGAKIMTWVSIALLAGGLFYLKTLLGNERIKDSTQQKQTEYNNEVNRGNPHYRK